MDTIFERLIAHWRKQGLPIRPGVSAERLRLFESDRGIRLPPEACEYFSTVDGLGPPEELDEHLFSFYSLEHLRPCTEIVGPFRVDLWPNVNDYYVFSEHSLGCPYYAMNVGLNRHRESVTLMYNDNSVREIATSLGPFFQYYLNNDLVDLW